MLKNQRFLIVAEKIQRMGSNLKLITLRVLDEEPSSGYVLVKKIHEKTGWKPSYGSIYPLLEKMKKKGLLTVKVKGRSKIYSLTTDGKKNAQAWDEKREKMLSRVKENMKVMAEFCGQDMTIPMQYMDRMKVDQNPLGDVAEEVAQLRNTILAMSLSSDFKKNSAKVKKVLKGTIAELKKLD